MSTARGLNILYLSDINIKFATYARALVNIATH